MFWKIFQFEIQYRLRRPAVYLCFALSFIFVFLSFAHGAMPLDEGQWINGTSALAFFVAIMSMMMMVVNSSVMGVALHRDIEYNTRDYYFSYPITRAGYFWGRYLASFMIVIAINVSVLLGAWLGSISGEALGWSPAASYGPNHFINYLYPFVTIAIPNLFFSASLFFGLVAVTQNIKVIYCSGIFLFLGYMIANFFMRTSASTNVIYLADPFAVNPLNFEKLSQTLNQKNTHLVSIHGLLLWNRVLWMGVSLLVLLITYWRFSFQKNSSARKIPVDRDKALNFQKPLAVRLNFSKKYSWRTFLTLVRIEVANITRDAYFWMILIGGAIFLAFVFSHGPGNPNARELPRTSMILFLFNQIFMLFVYCIIVFYAGEIVHRERDTGFAIINDALPPSTFVLHASKFTSLLLLTLFLSFTPMIIGLGVQLWMRFPFLNIPLYLSTLVGITFLKGIVMSMLAYFLHVVINRKFFALGVAIAFWILTVLAEQSGYLTYHLFLYASTPFYAPSDLDGLGHMLKPVTFFSLYWLLAGSLLVLVAFLFYPRGFLSGTKDRLQLAYKRYGRSSALVSVVLFILFVTLGAFNYYNINVKSRYYTLKETNLHAALIEKRLRHWKYIPQPRVRRVVLNADLYPSRQSANFRAIVTLENGGQEPIDSILLDGDNINEFQISLNGKPLPFVCPMTFSRGKYNFLSPAVDSSDYRIYSFPNALQPGDSIRLELVSAVNHPYFANDLYAPDLLHNGTCTSLGLPGLGYDEEEELRRNDERKEFGLPKREEEFPLDGEAEGRNKLLSGVTGVTSFLLTVSTDADQIVIAPGNKISEWKENDRQFFKYGFDAPGIYGPFVLISARYQVKTESVQLSSGKVVGINIYYDPKGSLNLERFAKAIKESLKHYSANYGEYPFAQFNLVETSGYTRGAQSTAALESFSERFAWSSKFSDDAGFDFGYYIVSREVAYQWWGNRVVPSHTRGSEVISAGLPIYCALALSEKRFGAEHIQSVISELIDEYRWSRGSAVYNQRPLLKATNWYDYNLRASLVLLGLDDLIGNESMNGALREFLDSFSFKTSPPYASTADLYAILEKHTPDSLRYFLRDNFENVCLYDNRINKVSSMALGGGKQYKVTIDFSVSKTYQDSVGKTIATPPMDDWIQIGVFSDGAVNNDKTRVLDLKKYKLKGGNHRLELIVDKKPAYVKLDPYMRLLDLNQADNMRSF